MARFTRELLIPHQQVGISEEDTRNYQLTKPFATVVLTNILYLAKYPWIQKKAQEELDRVCGDGRMPTWDDFKDLSYINCIVKESMRIRPV